MDVLLTFALIVSSIIALLALCSLRIKAYVLNCPSCKTKIHFPINENAMTCESCQKRLIISKNKIEVVMPENKIEQNSNDMNNSNKYEDLKRLQNLKEKGLITKEEFETEKEKLLK